MSFCWRNTGKKFLPMCFTAPSPRASKLSLPVLRISCVLLQIKLLGCLLNDPKHKIMTCFVWHRISTCLLVIWLIFPCAAYMHQLTGPALLQVMACRLFGAKPLPKSRLAYCQLDSWKQFQWNSNRNSIVFIKEDAFKIVVCQIGVHFAKGGIMAMEVSPLCPRLSGLVMGLPWSQQALISARVTSIESCK